MVQDPRHLKDSPINWQFLSQVPVPILEKRQRFLAMNWIIQAAKDKEKKVHLPQTLAKELVDASYNQVFFLTKLSTGSEKFTIL